MATDFYTTDVGQVRLLIPDTDEANQLLDDEQIRGFLAMEGSVKRAAAQALDVIASSEALISKKIRTQEGLQTDGPAVAKELRARATDLRAQADSEADGGGFDVIDFADPHTRRLGAELAEGWW